MHFRPSLSLSANPPPTQSSFRELTTARFIKIGEGLNSVGRKDHCRGRSSSSSFEACLLLPLLFPGHEVEGEEEAGEEWTFSFVFFGCSVCVSCCGGGRKRKELQTADDTIFDPLSFLVGTLPIATVSPTTLPLDSAAVPF